MTLKILGAAAAAGLMLVAAAIQRPSQEGRGGPPGVFDTKVPDHLISVVQSDPAPGSVSLSLIAPKSLDATVTVGSRHIRTLRLIANEPQNVRLNGVRNGEFYRITCRGEAVTGRISLPPPGKSAFIFVIQADSHLDQNASTEVYRRTLAAERAAAPAFLIDLGDTFMCDKHAHHEDSIPMYRAQHYWLGLVGAEAPIFLVLGNHDGEQGWVDRNRPGMDEWSATQRKLHFPPPTPGTWATGATKSANYFEFTWGSVQCIVLDPFHGTSVKPARTGDNWLWTLGMEQYTWLSRVLKSSKPAYRFVFIHHLVGGQGRDSRGGAEASEFYEWGGKNADGSPGFAAHRQGWEMPIHDLLQKYGVDAVFHGHDHFYARQVRGGLSYILVPQPGYRGRPNTNSAEEYGYRSGTILPSPGFMRVSVTPSSATIECVDPEGEVLDRMSLKP